jgi:iron complex outermembrane receptor protein
MVQKLRAEYEANPTPENLESLQTFEQLMQDAQNETPVFKEIDPRILFDLGATYQWRNLTVDLDIKNLFNKSYYQSGVSTGLIPQRGRWFLVTLGYKF